VPYRKESLLFNQSVRLAVNARSPESVDPLPTPSHSSTLCLRLFGPFRALIHGRPLPKTRTRKEIWLLTLLVLRADAPIDRLWLAGTLWPDATDEAALYNLAIVAHPPKMYN
jgi:hypothetical protein